MSELCFLMRHNEVLKRSTECHCYKKLTLWVSCCEWRGWWRHLLLLTYFFTSSEKTAGG